MLDNNTILIANIICWFLVTFRFYKKRKRVDSAVFLLSTFFVYSICSYLYFNYEYNGNKYINITIFPLVYLFLMILLTMSPVLRFNIAKIQDFPTNHFKILDFISWTFIICMVIKLPFDMEHIQEGLMRIMLDDGGNLYTDVMNEGRHSKGAYVISSIPTIFVNISVEIITLIAYYNLYKKRRFYLTCALFVSILLTPIGSIANGQRGGAFDVIIVCIGTYFLFAPILGEKIRKVAKKVGIVALCCIMVPIVAITYSRFGSRGEDAMEQSIYSYMGQQNINFDLYAFDNNGLRYGDRVFPLFKKILGFENVPNDFWERRSKYPNLKINDEVFIGYIGDFLLDYGPWISTLIFLIFTYTFLKMTYIRGRECHFYQLLAIQFVLTLGLQGGLKLYPFADAFALKLFSFGLLYQYLKIFSKNSKIHNTQLNLTA